VRDEEWAAIVLQRELRPDFKVITEGLRGRTTAPTRQREGDFSVHSAGRAQVLGSLKTRRRAKTTRLAFVKKLYPAFG
jgi:hypothetical protein